MLGIASVQPPGDCAPMGILAERIGRPAWRGGPGWATKTGWLTGEPCTGSTANWYGLAKDNSGDSGCNTDGSVWGMCAHFQLDYSPRPPHPCAAATLSVSSVVRVLACAPTVCRSQRAQRQLAERYTPVAAGQGDGE